VSIIEDIGAQVRAASDDLPLGLLTQAMEKFGQATERLRWVRHESANPMGVPELSAATEHAESAGHALRVAQSSPLLAASDWPRTARRAGRRPPRSTTRPGRRHRRRLREPAPNPTMRRWWSVPGRGDRRQEGPPTGQTSGSATPELLRRVVPGSAGDRDRLHTELRRAHADVGLVWRDPPLLRTCRRTAGRPPCARDLGRLRRSWTGRTSCPAAPPVLDTLPPGCTGYPRPPLQRPATAPADPAVTAGVLTGLLLARLGRDLPTDAEDRDERRSSNG
jgi:hypothetical protein